MNLPQQKTNFIITGEGAPVILVHGMAASLHNWDYLTPELVEAGYQVFALDLLGHGDSYKPEHHRNYNYREVYLHLENWITSLKLDKPALLCGHSLGGSLCLFYTRKHHEKVRGLVLIDPLYSQKQISFGMRLVNVFPKATASSLHLAPIWLINNLVGWQADSLQRINHRTRAQIAADYKRASPNIVYITQTIPDLTPNLADINSKTLVVWGEKDLTLKPTSFPHMVRTLPQAWGVPLAKCGHLPHLGKPGVFNRLVLNFLHADPA